jgi:hypothetical protein
LEFLYEAMVMNFLTLNRQFVCPRYSIKTDDGRGDWRCVDFVAMDFEEKRVILAEVTTAWNLENFVAKAAELHEEGRGRVGHQMNVDWPIEIHLFVREDRKDELEKMLHIRRLHFKVFTLEHAFRRWNWDAPNKMPGAFEESTVHVETS